MSKLLITGHLFLLIILSAHAQTPERKATEFFERGESAMKTGQWEAAVTAFTHCIAIDPSMDDAFLARARAREQLKEYVAAVVDYSILLERHPESFDIVLARANARFNAGQFAAARDDYQRLLTLPPGETNTVMFRKSASASGSRQITTAQSNLLPQIFSYLGMTELKLKNYRQALIWMDSAVNAEPGEADFYVNRGMVLEKSSRERAIHDYKKALEINPGHTLALHNLGVLTSKDGAGAQSEDYFDRAIESDSSMLTPYLERAYLRMQGGFFKGALEDYNNALQIEKLDPEIWLNRGYVKERLNDFKGAYADYTHALALDAEFVKALLNRGNVLNKLGKFADAIEDYSRAITFDPKYGPAYYNRAIARDRLKQKKEACEDLTTAEKLGIKIDPKLRSSACNP